MRWVVSVVSGIEIWIPKEAVEAIARRAAELALEQLEAGADNRPELLRVREAAELLRCSPQRIYELRSDGRLPRTSEGGRALVRRSDLQQLLVDTDARHRLSSNVSASRRYRL